MTDTLKSCYSHIEDGRLAVLDVVSFQTGACFNGAHVDALITRLNVPDRLRNKGIATKLLTQVCDDADNHGLVLCLECLPYTGTDERRLKKLYKRFRFQDIGGGAMVRNPSPLQRGKHIKHIELTCVVKPYNEFPTKE